MKSAYRIALSVLLISALAACDRDDSSETASAPGAPLPVSEPLTTETTAAPAPPTGNAEVAPAPQTPTASADGAAGAKTAPDTAAASDATSSTPSVTPRASTPSVASASPEHTKVMEHASKGYFGTTASPAASGVTGTSAAQPGAAMDRLLNASQQLREALQAMAQQPASEQRDRAMKDARQALYDTQQAMIRLPAEGRSSAQR